MTNSDNKLDRRFSPIEGLSQDEACKVVIKQFEKIKDKDNVWSGKPINEVIKEIQDKTPFGLEVVKLHQDTRNILQKVGKS